MRRFLPLLLIAVTAGAAGQDNPAMTDAAAAAVERQITVSPEVAKALDEVAQVTDSAGFRVRQAAAQDAVNRLLNLPDTEQSDSERQARYPHRAVLFVSSSVPITTLRHYARDLEAIDGVMVLRGLVGGMSQIGPTAQFVAAVLKVDPACEGPQCVMRSTPLLIDPLLFRANGIDTVPAFVFQPDIELHTYCNRDADASVPTAEAVIYGDSALSGLVAEYARLTGDARAKSLLKELDNG